jgi:hypothetical protein
MTIIEKESLTTIVAFIDGLKLFLTLVNYLSILTAWKSPTKAKKYDVSLPFI